MLNRVSYLGLSAAMAVLIVGLNIDPAPAAKGGGKGGNQDGGDGTSGLFVRADFRTTLQSGDAAQILSDLEGSPIPPIVFSACLPPFDYWDSRFDTVCTDPSSGAFQSNLSPHGRMHFFTRIGDDNGTGDDNRWVVLDFSTSPSGDGCPDLDVVLYDGAPEVEPPVNGDPCVDNLEVGMRADVLFAGASEQPFLIGINKDGKPHYQLSYLQPVLIVEDPDHPGDPDYRLLTTQSGGEDRSLAELISGANTTTKKDDLVVGTYNIHFEIAAHRIDCTGGCPSAP